MLSKVNVTKGVQAAEAEERRAAMKGGEPWLTLDDWLRKAKRAGAGQPENP